MNYLLLEGTEGNYASTPDVEDLDLNDGDIDIRAKVALDDWTPADTDQPIVSKWDGSSGYIFQVERETPTAGHLRFIYHDGSIRAAESTVTPTVNDGDWLWVRVTAAVNGANRDITFYTSTDTTDDPGAVTWTQLGDVVQVASNAAIVAGTSDVFVGAENATTKTASGKFAAVRLIDNATTRGDFDGDDFSVGDSDTDTAVDSTGKTWTLTGANTEIQSDVPGKLVGRSVHYDFTNRQVVIESGV